MVKTAVLIPLGFLEILTKTDSMELPNTKRKKKIIKREGKKKYIIYRGVAIIVQLKEAKVKAERQ